MTPSLMKGHSPNSKIEFVNGRDMPMGRSFRGWAKHKIATISLPVSYSLATRHRKNIHIFIDPSHKSGGKFQAN